jgi:hypothetical protein
VQNSLSNSASRSIRLAARRLAILLASAALPAAAANPEIAPPTSENAPLRFVTRAAEMRAEAFRASRAAAEDAMRRAEQGHCGTVVQRRSAQYREIVASADETAAKAAATVDSNPGKAASTYVQADKILQRFLDAAGTWRCGESP